MAPLVGLTGGIGCGKTVVAGMLTELGAAVIDADALARNVVTPGSPALAEIVERFGSEVITAAGTLDRRALGRVVFDDDAAREDLNAIVHPRVAALSMERIAELQASEAPLIVYDVPLLYERNLDQNLPAVIVVTVPADTQRHRIAARDTDLPADEIEARIAAQMPLAEKVARADHLIDNGGTLEQTRQQVNALWRTLTGEGKR